MPNGFIYTLGGPTVLRVLVAMTENGRGLPVLLEVLVETTYNVRGLPVLLEVLVEMTDNGRGLSASTGSSGGYDKG